MPKKLRADQLLVNRGLAESRTQAQRLILAGQVWADGRPVPKPAALLPESAHLEVRERPRYVSRGGEKLEAALTRFRVPVEGRICADVGASTGGFTDCLLQHGAARVYAIDVGHGQIHWKLRQDPRVVVMEGVNARYLESLPEPVDLVTVDVSFISVRRILPAVRGWLKPEGDVLVLIKPQFEAGKRESARGKGVIRKAEVHQRVLEEVLTALESLGYRVQGVMPSPIRGAKKGNIEFWAYLKYRPAAARLSPEELRTWIERAVREAHEQVDFGKQGRRP